MYLSCLHSEAFLPKYFIDLYGLRGESSFVPWQKYSFQRNKYTTVRWQQTLQQRSSGLQVFHSNREENNTIVSRKNLLDELHPLFVLLLQGWSQRGSKIVLLTSPAERGQRRDLCGSVAPGLQHVAWRLSNSGKSTLDRLEHFERQLSQLWGSAPTHSLVLLSQSGLMSTSQTSSPSSGLPLRFTFDLSSPQVEDGKLIFSLNYDELAKRRADHLFKE